MSFIGRFFTGAIVCAVGLAAIYFGVGMLPRSGEIAVAVDDEASTAGTPVDNEAAQSDAAESAPAPSSDPNVGHPANASLRTNAAGLKIIEESEGLRLEAYQAGGTWYIGYGHAGAEPGSTITEAEAERLLREDVRGYEDTVKKVVTVKVNENEFSAMVSLCYNLGGGNFGASSVVSKLNNGDRNGAADAFRNHNKAGGQVIAHLTERREKERALFLTPV